MQEGAQWRFEREIEALRRLHHPHIVEYLDSGITAGKRPFLVMQYVEAPDLKNYALLRDSALDLDEIFTLAEQTSAALAAAADNGIVHRDVKPSNILVDAPRHEHREPFCVKLCDFGLARFRETHEPDDASDHSRHGFAIGTPGYMSPEQAAGRSGTDQRQDIFGLGATLYFAVAGKPPYQGRPTERVQRTQTEGVDLEPLTRGELPPALLTLIGAMLAHRPDDRPATWAQVRRRLAACRQP
jgi:serine/threonine-protein kinase